MARRAPQPTLSPKMLQHFAVVTVFLTACLALFADGEGRNEFGQNVAIHEREAAAAVAAAGEKVKPKFALNTKIRDARRSYVPYVGEDGDSGAAYGAPMDSAAGSDSGGGGGGSSVAPVAPQPGPSSLPASKPLLPGPIKAQLGGTSTPDAPAKRPAAPHRPSQQELDRLEAMSMSRSGAS